MSNNKQHTVEEIKNLINAEIKIFIKKELENEIKRILSNRNGNARKEVNEIVKNGLAKFAEFMYVRKGVWQSDIK